MIRLLAVVGLLLASATARAEVLGEMAFDWGDVRVKVAMYDGEETARILRGVKEDRSLILYTVENVACNPPGPGANALSGFIVLNVHRIPAGDIADQFGPVPDDVAAFNPKKYRDWEQNGPFGGVGEAFEWDKRTGPGIAVGQKAKFGFTVPEGRYCLDEYPPSDFGPIRPYTTASAMHTWVDVPGFPGRRIQAFLVFGPVAGPAPPKKLPLGAGEPEGKAALHGMGDGCFKVYVPSRYGGKLAVKTTDGLIELFYDEALSKQGIANMTKAARIGGPAKEITHTVEQGKFGWYFIRVSGKPSAFELSDSFVEEAKADIVPWNFWYYPFNPDAPISDPGPHLFSEPGAYTKFDAHFALEGRAFREEFDKHRDPFAKTWAGHCWGGALASAALKQPVAAHGFTEEELEGLASDFFNRMSFAPMEKDWPFERPAAGRDPTDKFADEFQLHLRKFILDTKVRAPILMDLRQSDGAGSAEIWYQVVYRYTTRMVEAPDAVDDEERDQPLQILHTTRFVANDDFAPSAGDPETGRRREQEALLLLMYLKRSGKVSSNAGSPRDQDWIRLLNLSKLGAPSVPIPERIYDVRRVGIVFEEGSQNAIGANTFVTPKRLKRLGLQWSGLK